MKKLVFGSEFVEVGTGDCNYCGEVKEIFITPIAEKYYAVKQETELEWVGTGEQKHHFPIFGKSGYIFPDYELKWVVKEGAKYRTVTQEVETGICKDCAKQIGKHK